MLKTVWMLHKECAHPSQSLVRKIGQLKLMGAFLPFLYKITAADLTFESKLYYV